MSAAAVLNLQGLEQFRASALLEPQGVDAGAPGHVLLELVDFDPEQPRRTIDEAALAELASSIRELGVLEPVSLRPHPVVPGRFIINRGERRVRASRLAGLMDIPCFVDARVDPYAQVIENLQREDLSPFDLARFVALRESLGESRAAIARKLHKSPSFVTEVAELERAPAQVRTAYESGRVRDMRVLYRLARTWRSDPAAAQSLIDDAGAITRRTVPSRPPAAAGTAVDQECIDARDEVDLSTAPRPVAQRCSSRSADALLVEHGGRRGRLGLSGWPGRRTGEVRFDDGSRQVLELSDLKFIAWTVR